MANEGDIGPLGLRTGSVRAILAIIVITTACVLAIISTLYPNTNPGDFGVRMATAIQDLAKLAFGFYVGSALARTKNGTQTNGGSGTNPPK